MADDLRRDLESPGRPIALRRRTPTMTFSPPPQFDLARLILAILAILGLLIASLWVLSPFFTALVWATMIAVACWPLLIRLQELLHGRRTLAVTAMTVAMLLVFIVPLVLAANTLLDNADNIVRWAKAAATYEVPPAPAWVGELPLVGARIAELWNGLHDAGLKSLVARAAPYAGQAAQWFAAQAGNVGLLVVHFLLTVVIATVMFAQGEQGARRLLANRVGGGRGEEAVRLAGAAIRGVALGVVVTALLQTIVAGFGLAIAGIPFAGLLTAGTLILCIAQVGAGPVMIPATIWLFWSDQTGWGVFLALWSALVLTMDNFIRPFLIRRGADLPLLLIFAGVIGGLLTMGLVGLFVGPVVLAVTWRLFEAWAGLYAPPGQAAAAMAAAPAPAAGSSDDAAVKADAGIAAVAAGSGPLPAAGERSAPRD
jgi:predicted PurR-regulated permease PerM